MTEVIPDSSSVILRATHILLLCTQAAQIGEWSPASGAMVSRTVGLTLQLEEQIKGKTREQPGTQIQIRVTQYAPKITRIFQVPGVWSEVSIEPGNELVAFCHSSDDVAANILLDQNCERILPTADALDDVRLALEVQTRNLTLADVLQQASLKASSVGLIFVEFLWARYGKSAMEQPEYYQALMEFIRHPDLSYTARATLLDAVYSHLLASPDAPPERVQDLAITMFELLDVNQAENFHDNLLEVFLPNLLGLTGGIPQTTANELFQNNPQKRQLLEGLLRRYPGLAPTNKLLEWLR